MLQLDARGSSTIAGDRAINRAWQSEFRLADLQKGVAEDLWPAEPDSSGTAVRRQILPARTSRRSYSSRGGQHRRDVAPDAYVYSNVKWFGPSPMEESYLINVNTGDAGGANGTADAFRSAIVAAGNTWSNAGAAFSFKYGGTSSITTTGYDEKNVIHWESMGNTPTLAEATWWKYDNGQIVETDIRFNDYYAWDATGQPSSSEPDLQSIATHELGHWLSLAHDTDSGCPNSSACDVCVLRDGHGETGAGRERHRRHQGDLRASRLLHRPPTPTRTYTPPRTPTPTRTYGPTLSPRQIKSRVYLPMIRRSR